MAENSDGHLGGSGVVGDEDGGLGLRVGPGCSWQGVVIEGGRRRERARIRRCRLGLLVTAGAGGEPCTSDPVEAVGLSQGTVSPK